MVTEPRFMHGVGLLRISQTPVTVDREEYVVFVGGWLCPRGFASWKEANDYFQAIKESRERRRQTRLQSGVKLKAGRRPGETSYQKALKEAEKIA